MADELSDALRDVTGVVYGVHLHGRAPALFRRHLWPLSGDPVGARSGRAARRLGLSYETVDAVDAVEAVRGVDAVPGGGGLWQTEVAAPGGTVEQFTLSGGPGGFTLAVGGAARGLFRCTPEAIHVQWAGPAGEASHYFFAYALPLWLETRGVPVLHGSSVTVGGRAVGFVAPSGTGKSVLCAELLRLGCGFVADDGLALERGADGAWHCLPGPPLLRLWPSGLGGHLAIAPESLPRVRADGDKRSMPLDRIVPPTGTGTGTPGGEGVPGTGHEAPRLAALYLLGRRADVDGPVELSSVKPREALVRLIEHGIAAAPAAALGLAARRLETLAAVGEAVPLRQLAVPSGPGSAARVLAAIERDLDATPA